MRAIYVVGMAAVLGVGSAGAGWAQSPGGEPPAPGTVVALSLEEAVARAVNESQEVKLARSQVDRAAAQVKAARSAALPQINGSIAYTRTFESPFESGGAVELPDSLRFEPDPTAPLEERVSYLEDRVPIAALGGLGQLFGNLPFGQENQYVAAITGTQLLYSGGRVGAALDIASNFEESARLGVIERVAEVEQQVRTAYYQALLAREMEEIARAALDQAEAFLEQERLRERAGQASDLDVMRAEVSAENLRPQLVQARNAADLAMFELKRLLNLPLDQPLELTTPLGPPGDEVLAAPGAAEREVLRRRAALEAAERQVAIREQQVKIAKRAYLPTVSLHATYGRQLYPTEIFDFSAESRTDWNAGVTVQLPIFDGLKRSADVEEAEAALEEARLQLEQLRESITLQYEQARRERERARADIAARQRTVEQAERVYALTELQYEKGMATQLEVSEARLALLQARTNLAQALTDYHIADAALLRALGGSEVVSRGRAPGGAPRRHEEPAGGAPTGSAPARSSAPGGEVAPRGGE
ncbi:MAG TPA: TolC family protein [Longimicrobiales bacterium]